MLEQYQTEIFALLGVLVVILIYLMIKNKSSKDSDSLEETEIDILETDIDELVQEETDESADESIQEEVSSESFPDDDSKKRQKDNIDTIEPKHNIPKRDVPKHGKITKDNFKEFAGTRILVAEDNLINQKVIKGLLADTGIEVSIADDGQECLDILEKDSDFLLVLMDAHMPRVDGFEATRTIRENPDYDHILVVALSGDTAADDIKKMTEAGMSEHLEKPLRMEALYDIFYAYSVPKESLAENDNESTTDAYKEFNANRGLEICGGDKEFYQEILREFVNTYENSTQKLGDLLRTGKREEADKLLLDIVGVTANIGADNLNKISHIIKASLNDTTEKSYLTLVEQYKTSLENLLVDIKEYK